MPAWASLVGLKLVVSGWVVARGVTAISDDDFARVVIAQEFAQAPSLDPSGTSWLPLPFWIYGTPMLLLGRSWEVARSVAVLLGVASVCLVYVSGRLLGAGPRGAWIGAVLAALFPYSAWLGVSTVPELPTASLVLFAMACGHRALARARSEAPDLQGPARSLATIGALCITAACASRYEAWPVALGLAAILALAAPLGPRRIRLPLALLAVSFPLAWLAHGFFRHDDAFFFVRRVAEYKRAVGAADGAWLETLWVYPRAFLESEPELLLGAGALVVVFRTSLAWRLPALLLSLQLLVLAVGDIRGGGPTHHPERALVTGWLFAALLAGDAITRAPRRFPIRQGSLSPLHVTGLALIPLLFGAYSWLRRPDLASMSFSQRGPELEVGRMARELTEPGEKIVVATEDYGYFAIAAAFGAPERVHVLERHDPRLPAPSGDSASDDSTADNSGPERLRTLAARHGARQAIVPRTWPRGAELGSETAGNSRFTLRLLEERADENSPPRAELH